MTETVIPLSSSEMTQESAGVLAWAQRASITVEEAWAEMQSINEEVDWDPERMLSESTDEEQRSRTVG